MDRDSYIPLVDAALRKSERRLAASHREMQRVEAAPGMLYEAELLKSAHPKPYDKEVRVMDYVTNTELVIPLEPGVPFQVQLQKRFRQARRLADSEGPVLLRLANVERELAYLKAHRASLDGDDWRVDEALLPRPKRSKNAEPLRELPYREYKSRAGRAIWVGKSGTANDTLTFKVASPHAAWFHVSGYPGSHVVVQKRRAEVLDPVTRQDAALLAAHFSKAPNDWVEVSMTEVKFVRKFKGAKTGQVHLSREQHERVMNDPERVKPLLAVSQV